MKTLDKVALFWDVNRDQLDVSLHADFIIKRILSQGDIEDAHFMFENYSNEKVTEVLSSMRGLDQKSYNFWTNRLNHA
jgi:hypothetical protein